MKNTLARRCLLLGAMLAGCTTMMAQEKPQLDAKREAEKTPLILSYEPEYETKAQREREALEQKIARIDSLDISATRRYKLIQDLYRNKDSKRLQKALYAGTKFEDSPLD